MRIFIACIMIFFGFMGALLLKTLVNHGCHHTAHCIETFLLIVAIISIICNNYWELTMVTVSMACFRNLFRIVSDCIDLSKKNSTVGDKTI